MKCENCRTYLEAIESEEPALCRWYVENVVCGDKTTEDCNNYISIEDRCEMIGY